MFGLFLTSALGRRVAMADPAKLYKEAQATLIQGGFCENRNDVQGALQLYQHGVQALIFAIRADGMAKRKQDAEAVAMEYLAKIERLQGRAVAPGRQGAGGGGGGRPGSAGSSEGGGAEAAPVPVSASVADLVTRCSTPWDAIAGLESVKATLREVVIAPLQFPSWFAGEMPDERPWNGILLYGPPGTGKSLLAKAVCTELGAQVAKRFPGKQAAFFSVKVSDVLKPYLGQSEARVQEIFAEARKVTPCVVFIDEVDSLGGDRGSAAGGGEGASSDTRRSVLNQLLTEMDGVGKNNKGLLVLAATNAPKGLDGALLRRFQKRVYIPLPDKAARVRLMQISFGSRCVGARGILPQRKLGGLFASHSHSLFFLPSSPFLPPPLRSPHCAARTPPPSGCATCSRPLTLRPWRARWISTAAATLTRWC